MAVSRLSIRPVTMIGSVKSSRPPGRRTRAASAKKPARSAMWQTASLERMASNEPSSNGRPSHVRANEARPLGEPAVGGEPVRCLDAALVHVDAHDGAAGRPGDVERRAARTAADSRRRDEASKAETRREPLELVPGH